MLLNCSVSVIRQFNFYFGEQTTWIAENAVRVEQAQLGIVHLLHKVDDWQLTAINRNTRKIHQGTLDAFISEKQAEDNALQENLEGLNESAIEIQILPLQPVGSTTIAGLKATEYWLTYNFKIADKTWTNLQSVWLADDLLLPASASLVLSDVVRGIPDTAVLLRSATDEGKIDFDTAEFERIEMPVEELLETPSDFEHVATFTEAIGDSYMAEGTATAHFYQPD